MCLLVKLFQLFGQEKQNIEKHATKASLNESDYIHTFDDVAFVLKSIAFPYGTSLHNQICKDIEEIKDDPMLRVGYQIIKKVMLIFYHSNFYINAKNKLLKTSHLTYSLLYKRH